jgi:hypothetical protein
MLRKKQVRCMGEIERFLMLQLVLYVTTTGVYTPDVVGL